MTQPQPQIKLPANIAGALILIASGIPMLTALVAGIDPEALGLEADTVRLVAAWLTVIGGLVNIPVVLLRLNVIPGITSGNALDAPK